MPPKRNQIVRKEIDNMLEAGIVVSASSARSIPVVITAKHGKPMFCVDYHALYRVMKAKSWFLRHIAETFDKLAGFSCITTRDLFSGYWKIPPADKGCHTAKFVTRYGT